jgi:DNA-binding winged helix-turn-helix (wHTH) protein/Tol biopolymer transport system component
MSKQASQLYEFGPFRVDPRECQLLRDGKALALTPKAFETLLVLVQNAGHLIPKEELMKTIWPDSYVEDVNLSQNISMLRKALGDQAQASRYIVTVPGRGYRFTQEVRSIPEHGEIVFHSRAIAQVVIDEEALTDASGTPISEGPAIHNRRRTLVFGAAILVLALAAVAFRPSIPPPKVIQVRQLTHLGNLIHNTRLLTDGPRVYFRALEGEHRVIRYTSPEGGQVFPIAEPFPEMDIEDISPSGSEFLVTNYGGLPPRPDSRADMPSLWRVPVPGGSPRPLGDVHARDARWSPDGKDIAYSVGADLYLASPDGSNSRKVASLPGEPIHLVWSSDGKCLRFGVTDQNTNKTALWQVDIPSKIVHPSLPDGNNPGGVLAGGWTPDGRYFFYAAGEGTTRNIWAIRQDGILRRVNPQPMQITNGPVTFFTPLPGKDGKTVYAVGRQLRGQLLRYDASTRQFAPYAQGISADHVTFSRDGQWMAYLEFPDATLVRSRADGSERQQLTFPPMRASNPQWSPDGTQIAFQAAAQEDAHKKVYLVSSSGGVPVMAAPEGRDLQTYPSWASDGSSILFSSSDVAESQTALHWLDLKTKHVSLLPGSEGLYDGQLSPDGRYAAALEDITQRLVLYDMVAHTSRVLGRLADYPRWSSDGQYLYFSTLYFNAPGKTGGVYRWKVPTNTTETVVTFPDFPLTGVWGMSYSLTPDNAPLLLRDMSTSDLYALDMELP